MSVITALDNSVTCTVHQRWTRNVSANAPKQQWWFVLSTFTQVFYWKTHIYIITFCKTTYVYIPRTFITLTLDKNMGDWVHAGHKTHPAVISTRLKPVTCMVPPPKDLMRSLEFLWAFGKSKPELAQITREIFSLTLYLSRSLSAMPPVCDPWGQLRNNDCCCCWRRKA